MFVPPIRLKHPNKGNKMKKTTSSLIAIFLGAASLLNAQVLTVTDDAEVRDSDPTTNYGSATQVIADVSGIKGYLKFDASSLGYSITDITSFTGVSLNTSYPRQGNFYLITGTGADSWDQSTITWNNAPGNDTSSVSEFLNNATFTSILIGQNELAAAGSPESVDFSWVNQTAKDAVITELNTGDRIATIAFSRNSTRSLNIASLENSTYDAYNMTVVPEPSQYGLILGTIGIFLVLVRRRKRSL
jgi:hypothetical protein